MTTKGLFTVRDREGNEIQIGQNQHGLLGRAGDESPLDRFKCPERSAFWTVFGLICEAVKVTAMAYGSGHGRFKRRSPSLPCPLLEHDNKNNTSTLTIMWDRAVPKKAGTRALAASI